MKYLDFYDFDVYEELVKDMLEQKGATLDTSELKQLIEKRTIYYDNENGKTHKEWTTRLKVIGYPLYSEQIIFEDVDGRMSHYWLTWNIDELKRLIREDNLQPVEVDTEHMVQSIWHDEIDEVHADEPVIMGIFEPHHQNIVLHGQSIILDKQKQGEKNIQTYIVDEDTLLDALIAPFMKKLYLLHKEIEEKLNQIGY